MKNIRYMSAKGSITLNPTVFKVVRELTSETLALDLLQHSHPELFRQDAAALLKVVQLSCDYPYSYVFWWEGITELNIEDCEYNLIHTMYTAAIPMKVPAIKFLKEQYGLRLKAAKDICDAIGNNEFQ